MTGVQTCALPISTKTYEDFLRLIDEINIGFEIAHAFNSINIDPSVKITILHPGTTMADINNNSVVFKLQHTHVGFMLTGDAEAEAEKYLMERTDSATLQSTVLKVGHHGSRTSTTDTFLSRVSPSKAVIMAGQGNTYGHPHPETITKLTRAGIEIYRTDLQGNIIVTSDGSGVKVTTSKGSVIQEPVPTPEPSATLGTYVGSIKSDKYHYPTCRHATTINQENEIWFDSKSEAQAAGYVPCGACKP